MDDSTQASSVRDGGWSAFWDERGRSYPDDDPVGIDGWDYGISRMGQEEAEALRRQAAAALVLDSASTLLEVGCGAGMFLIPLSGQVRQAVGCDLALPMLIRARQMMPSLLVQAAEASQLPYTSASFDAVLVYSVFHYFPSCEYAGRALREIARVCRPGGRIWIADVPDKTKQDQALAHRTRLMQQERPKWRWPEVGPLTHRFYDREFFADHAQDLGCELQVLPQSVPGYVQGQYRFNILLQKQA
jgi:ubiquinone/menaquinone biosynthesis C-methylase UbiE